jgi:hypothetical protein
MLASNLPSCFLCLFGAGIVGMHHHSRIHVCYLDQVVRSVLCWLHTHTQNWWRVLLPTALERSAQSWKYPLVEGVGRFTCEIETG